MNTQSLKFFVAIIPYIVGISIVGSTAAARPASKTQVEFSCKIAPGLAGNSLSGILDGYCATQSGSDFNVVPANRVGRADSSNYNCIGTKAPLGPLKVCCSKKLATNNKLVKFIPGSTFQTSCMIMGQ